MKLEFINSNTEQLKNIVDISRLKSCLPGALNANSLKVVLLLEDHINKGYGLVWNEKFHPFRTNVYIEIFEEFRRRGLGTRLYNYIAVDVAKSNLKCEIDNSNKGAANFLRKLGFFVIKKKEKFKFSSTDLATVFIPYGEEPNLMKISELTEESRDVLYSMLLIDYNRLNKSNPTDISLSFENWKEHITKDLLYWDSYFDFREGAIYSYLLSYKSDDRDTVNLKFTSATRRDLRYGKFLAEALRNLFRNYKYIEIEFDSKDLSKEELRKLFKTKQNTSVSVYIKNY